MSSEKKRNSLTFGKNNFVSTKLKNQNKENKKREKKYKTTTISSDKNIKKINEIIKNKNLTSRIFSRSFAERYIPLSKKEKENEIKNMNESSLNRFKTYSNIFEQNNSNNIQHLNTYKKENTLLKNDSDSQENCYVYEGNRFESLKDCLEVLNNLLY